MFEAPSSQGTGVAASGLECPRVLSTNTKARNHAGEVRAKEPFDRPTVVVTVRQATEADIEAYAAIQEDAWDDSMSASPEKLRNRIALFPEGTLVAEHDGSVVGALSTILLADYSIDDALSWEDLTENGWCDTHTPNGSVLFGVDLSVAKGAPRTTAAMILMAGIDLAMRQGVERIVWGGRMPRYHKHADKYSPQEYLEAKNRRGRYLDPEVDLYSKIPGVEIVGIVPEYFKDWESLNYGVMLSWKNPIHRLPKMQRLRQMTLRYLYRPGQSGRRAEVAVVK